MNSSQKLAVGGAAAVLAGWGLYRYWWVPRQAQDAIANEMALRIQQGQSPQRAAEGVFQALCQTGGGLLSAKYGIPPQYAASLCQGLSMEGILDFAKMSTTGAGEIVSLATQTVTHNVEEIIGGVESIVTRGSEAVWNLGVGLPTKFAERAVNEVADTVKDVSRGIQKGVEATAKGIEKGVKDTAKGIQKGLEDFGKKIKFW